MKYPLKIFLAVLVVSFCLSGVAVAGPFDDAVAAYERGDYATALRLLRPLAEQGEASAQFRLGAMLEAGNGVPQDYAEAMKWYRMAAEQGNAGGQYNLGVMYEEGKGDPQDYAEAARLYRMAAEQGHAGGQYNLGVLYLRGNGVPRDYVQAHKWFNLAAANYPAGEREYRQDAVMNRGIAAKQMTRAQIAEAERLAREWKPKVESGAN